VKVGIFSAMKSSSLVKNVDSKGRIALGSSFANSTVLIEEGEGGEIIIKRASVIPQREAWLYDNKTALASLRRGLSEAAERKFAKGPDLKASGKLAGLLLEE
jgi:hypothetical protein